MFSESWKDVLNLDDLNLKDYELIRRIAEARAKRLEEVEMVLSDGKKVKIKLNYPNPKGIIGSDVWGW